MIIETSRDFVLFCFWRPKNYEVIRLKVSKGVSIEKITEYFFSINFFNTKNSKIKTNE